MRWLFGWRYISSLHSAGKLQQERNNCSLLRSYFIGSCHVGVSKCFSVVSTLQSFAFIQKKQYSPCQNESVLPLPLPLTPWQRDEGRGVGSLVCPYPFACSISLRVWKGNDTVLTSSNKSETAVHCCDPALSVLVMLVCRNVFP